MDVEKFLNRLKEIEEMAHIHQIQALQDLILMFIDELRFQDVMDASDSVEIADAIFNLHEIATKKQLNFIKSYLNN